MTGTVRNSTTNTLDTISRRVEAAREGKIENPKITIESPGIHKKPSLADTGRSSKSYTLKDRTANNSKQGTDKNLLNIQSTGRSSINKQSTDRSNDSKLISKLK